MLSAAIASMSYLSMYFASFAASWSALMRVADALTAQKTHSQTKLILLATERRALTKNLGTPNDETATEGRTAAQETIMIPESVMIDVYREYPGLRGPLALFSGGNDSLCSTHFAMEHGAHGVVHVNTGIGIPQTREFVRDTCKDRRWPLREIHPPAMSYREMVIKNGFPGPGAHKFAYSWLKERAIRQVWGTRPKKEKALDQTEIPWMPLCAGCPTKGQFK